MNETLESNASKFNTFSDFNNKSINFYNLGNLNETNNLVDNYYEITNISLDPTLDSYYLEFDFSIGSIGSSAGFNLFNKTSDFYTYDNYITNFRNNYGTPPFSGRYIKRTNKPASFALNNNLFAAVTNNNYFNTPLMAAVTDIRKVTESGQTFYYLNEFREKENYFKNQIPLSFSVDDSLEYWRFTPSSDENSVRKHQSYYNMFTLKIVELNSTYTTSDNLVVPYDYKCISMSGDIPNPFKNQYTPLPEISFSNTDCYAPYFSTLDFSNDLGLTNTDENWERSMWRAGTSESVFIGGVYVKGVSLATEKIETEYLLGSNVIPKTFEKENLLDDYYKLDPNFTSSTTNTFSGSYIRAGKTDVVILKTNNFI